MWIKLSTTGSGPHIPSRPIWVNMDNVNSILFQDYDRVIIGYIGDVKGYEFKGMTEKQFIEIINTKDQVFFEPDGYLAWADP
jgi:hypothetical protein